MPSHRGIKINLISQWRLKVHPEFPHPESFKSSSQAGFALDGQHLPYTFNGKPNDEAIQVPDEQKIISVYTPSLPDAKFWVRWTVTEQALQQSQWFYFKLYMNGRHITSWGTNAYKRPSGQVMRGLFEPSDRWNYESEGVIYKNMGTEVRPFRFVDANDGKSTAQDGGLIEIQVFRALGRKRKLAEPTDFKSQEVYGIAMPSVGLLERPEDAKFYDWHLKDPKDDPFVVFKFHYRSWDSLQSSQLIPEGYSRGLHSPTRSLLSILGDLDNLRSEIDKIDDRDDQFDINQYLEPELDEDWDDGCDSFTEERDTIRNNAGRERSNGLWSSVFDDSVFANEERVERSSSGVQYGGALIITDPHKVDLVSRFNSTSLQDRTPDIAGPSKGMQYDDAPINPDPSKVDLLSRFNAASDGPTPPRNGVRSRKQGKLSERPLPEIPQRISSRNAAHSRHSSIASRVSSITPSLQSYVENRETSSPEPVFATATALPLQKIVYVGKAQVVNVISRKPIVPALSMGSSPPDTSPEESPLPLQVSKMMYNNSILTPPTRTTSAKHQPKPLQDSPLTEFFSQPNIANITVRKHKRSPGNLLARLSISGSSFRTGSPFRSATNPSRVAHQNVDVENAPEQSPSAAFKSTITESEWMCRTPSPVKNNHENNRYENIWSPSPGESGKKRSRRGTETSIKQDIWSGSPMINASNATKKVERSASSSKERLAQKAMDLFEYVRSTKDSQQDVSSMVQKEQSSNDLEVNNGWI